MAEIGAKYAEDAFAELKVKFNHIVTRKIPLIFYNTHIHFQQTNTRPGFIPEGVGGFFEFLKGRVVIPYLGSLGDFEHVIRHELVHVFMTNKVFNVLSNHRIPTNRFPSLWFVEGLAEFWSTSWDAQADMVMRDAVLNNIFIGLRDMDKVYGSFIMYKAGQNFLEFVAEEYGEDKILLFIDNIWRFDRFNDVIEFTLDENLEVVDDKYEYYLKRRYYPLVQDQIPHKIASRKITNKGFNFSPAYYTDGKEKSIYFIANRDGYGSLYRLELSDESNEIIDPELLVRGEQESVYEAFHLFKPSLAVSSQGIVAFVTKAGSADALHLYSINDKSVIESLKYGNLISIEAPQFSEDGNQVTFSAIDRKGFTDIFVYDIPKKSLNRLTNDYYSDKEPLFSSDGKKIIFTSDRTEGMFAQAVNLFSYDLESGAIDYLTYVNANISTPRKSPSGDIYFTSDYEDILNIWKLDYDKNNSPNGMHKVSDFLTSVFEFSFIDEKRIVTSAIEKFSFQFYIYDLTGSESDISKFVGFNFTLASSKWEPKKIQIKSEKDKLEYENEYTLDYAVSQVIADPVYGARGGAILTLSDLLGDDRYVFLIYNTAEVQSEILKNFNVAISRVNTKYRTNFAYGVFHFSGRRYDIRESEEYFNERSFGGYLSFIFPFSMFQRIETSLSVANSDKELFDDVLTRKALLITNAISFVHDNSIWGPTGPLDGSRFRLLLGYTSDAKFSNVNYYSVIADYRNYLRLGFRTSLASRFSIFYNHGKEARRYFAGGSWDLRGWRRFSIRGEKLWLSSLELRYPLIDQLTINFPFLGIGFFNIRGAAFVDAGAAWDEEYDETLGSVGIGIRINFLNAIALRYDVGKRIENGFREFQNGLFYQFFFGWDF